MLLEDYRQLKGILAEVEMDLVKASTGNKSAARRARKKLKTARVLTCSIIKGSLT